MSRVAALVLAAALCLAAVPAADAAKKPLRCKSGFGKLTLNGAKRCVRNAQLLPRLPAASSPWLPYLRWAVQEPEHHIFTTRVGGKVVPLPSFGIAAPSVNAALTALKPYGDSLQLKLTGQAAPRRAPAAIGRHARLADGPAVTLGPSVVTSTATGASITGTMTSRDAVTGVTTTVELGAQAQKGKDGKIDPTATSMELTFGIATDAGKSATFTLAMDANGKDRVADRCPSAAGVVRRDSTFNTRGTSNDTSELFVQENSEAKTMSFNSKFRGFVDENAKLERVNYDIHTRFSSTRRARAVFGLIDIVTRIRIGVDATGSMNGRTGAITKGTTNVTVTFNSTELTGAQIAAQMRSALADGTVRAKMEKMASEIAARAYASMKETEKNWRKPNACAKATFTPGTAILAAGSSKTIKGNLRAESNRVAEAKWKRLRIGPGSVVSGLAGNSAPGAPVRIKVKAGRPNADGATVLLKTRATSRAGIAETTWRADGDVPDLYFKVDDVAYTAGYTGSLSGAITGCNVTASSNESAHATNRPFDPANRLRAGPDESYAGAIGVGNGATALRTGTSHGCDLSMELAPCDVPFSLNIPLAVGFIVTMPPKQPAKVTWALAPPVVGGGVPLVGECYVPPVTAVPATPLTTNAPRDVFLEPGPHVLSATRPISVHVSVGITTILNGSASVTVKFHRVNADGSPYTG